MKNFSATTSSCAYCKVLCRHVRSILPAALPCLEVACILATASICLQCTADWSAACNCTLFSYSAARLLMLLWRRRCATVARRLLDAEGWCWHKPSRSVASTPCVGSSGVARSFACFFRQLWNRKSACSSILACRKHLNEVLSVVSAEQVLSGHQWLFSLEPSKNTCNGVHQAVPLQSSCWQHIVLPLG